MDANLSNKKIIQVTEEALSPVHVPLVIGNEFYVITQQDVRKIEDSRLLTYSKLMPNGCLKPLDNNQYNNLLLTCKLNSLLNDQNNNNDNGQLLAALMQINQLQHQQQQQVQLTLQMLQQLQPQAPLQLQTQQQLPQPMEIISGNCFDTQNNNVSRASIEEQLKWEKSINTSFCSFTYSKGTSTTDLPVPVQHNKHYRQHQVQTCCSCCCCDNCRNKRENDKDSTNLSKGQENVTTQTQEEVKRQGQTQTEEEMKTQSQMQTEEQTQVQNQTQIEDQTQTQDQTQSKDQTQTQDQTQTENQTQTNGDCDCTSRKKQLKPKKLPFLKMT